MMTTTVTVIRMTPLREGGSELASATDVASAGSLHAPEGCSRAEECVSAGGDTGQVRRADSEDARLRVGSIGTAVSYLVTANFSRTRL